MEGQPRGFDKVMQLIGKGVDIPNPLSLDIGPEVDVGRISSEGVTIYPGCRLYGANTVISAGAKLGAEAPATVDDCRLGPGVELKGGYYAKSVFLEGANLGSGAQVREGCLLEEEANGAHCVGLKQTILFPFVTLGSLVNFCDCLMAGGTSRKDHSEVGSSYIHFNFTPDGTKTTPSLFGDVPRGVMLNQPRIFLGGQGGTVGPVRVGYGTVVGAGSVLRDDVLTDGLLVLPPPVAGLSRPDKPRSYKRLAPLVEKNVAYLAQLAALEAWYTTVRRPFFEAQEFGGLVYAGALELLASARLERSRRLSAMVATVAPEDDARRELRERIEPLLAVFAAPEVPAAEAFLRALPAAKAGYVATIRSLSPAASELGVRWLQQLVESLCARAAAQVPSLRLFAAR